MVIKNMRNQHLIEAIRLDLTTGSTYSDLAVKYTERLLNDVISDLLRSPLPADARLHQQLIVLQRTRSYARQPRPAIASPSIIISSDVINNPGYFADDMYVPAYFGAYF
jgi:hypothetical protein